MKKTLSLILALIFMLTLIAACGNSTVVPEESTTAAADTGTAEVSSGGETEAETDFPEIPEGTDLKQMDFCILYYDAPAINSFYCPCDVFAEDMNGEHLTDTVFKRNKAVEAKLNCKISILNPAKNTYASTLKNSVNTGDNNFSMCDINIGNVITLFNQNLLRPSSVLDVDFTKPWYDQKTNEQMTLCGKQIAFAPATLFIDKIETVVTFYNANLGEDLNIGSLYEFAEAGNFTLEYMLQFASKVTADLNHDGKMDQNDAYCISSQNDFGYYSLLSAGISSASSTKTSIEMNLSKDKTVDVLQKTSEIMSDPTVFFNRQTYKLGLPAVCQMFANNQCLFLLRPLHTLYELREYDQKFEILPSPKFNSDQVEYSTPVNHYAGTIFCVPAGFTDYSDIGLVSDVLAAQSYYDVLPIFYDVVLDYKLVNDPRASKMLDLAFETRAYDLGCIFKLGNVTNLLVAKEIPNVASAVVATEKNAVNSIKNLVKELEKFN